MTGGATIVHPMTVNTYLRWVLEHGIADHMGDCESPFLSEKIIPSLILIGSFRHWDNEGEEGMERGRGGRWKGRRVDGNIILDSVCRLGY